MKKYLANGRSFDTYEAVVSYAETIGCRVANTYKLAGKVICDLVAINPKHA